MIVTIHQVAAPAALACGPRQWVWDDELKSGALVALTTYRVEVPDGSRFVPFRAYLAAHSESLLSIPGLGRYNPTALVHLITAHRSGVRLLAATFLDIRGID